MYIAIESEPLQPGEPHNAPTILEAWGPFATEDDALEWADNMATAQREHSHARDIRHQFYIIEMRAQVAPIVLIGQHLRRVG